MNEIIFSVKQCDDGAYEAVALGHSIYTECDSYDELHDTLRDAVRCHFDEDQRPAIIHAHIVKDEIIKV